MTLLMRTLVVLAMGLAAAPAVGQPALEVISLRHRPADQVVPALQPLLEPGATLTAHGNQLIVRTSPANLAELVRALEAIDRPARRLQIAVRYGDAVQSSRTNAGLSGRIDSRGARIEGEALARDTGSAVGGEQRIQVLEGARAYIASGRSTPVFDGSAWHETVTGFEAVPRLAGGRVLVDIYQRRDALDRQDGLSTTVSGPIGEWFEVGGAMEEAARRDSTLFSASRAASAQARGVWLKVEELR